MFPPFLNDVCKPKWTPGPSLSQFLHTAASVSTRLSLSQLISSLLLPNTNQSDGRRKGWLQLTVGEEVHGGRKARSRSMHAMVTLQPQPGKGEQQELLLGSLVIYSFRFCHLQLRWTFLPQLACSRHMLDGMFLSLMGLHPVKLAILTMALIHPQFCYTKALHKHYSQRSDLELCPISTLAQGHQLYLTSDASSGKEIVLSTRGLFAGNRNHSGDCHVTFPRL